MRSGSGSRTACITSSTRLPAFALVELGMDVEHFGDLVAEPHDRIERGHRLLEDHRDAVAADAAHLGARLHEQVVAFEQHAARRRGELAGRQQAHDGVRGDGLARAGLADHANDLARRDRERHVLDRVHAVRAVGQADREPLHVEDGLGVGHHIRRASFGSSRSRKPSPSTLTASTVSARQMPGKKMLCG